MSWRAGRAELGGRFLLGEPIGAGGMAHVYRALDRVTGAQVAVKILLAPDPTTMQRFAREASLLSRLDHPAIVRYLADGVTSTGQPYIAMQWIEGEDLGRRLQRGALGCDETIALARRMADALAAAHEHGVVHRDVKPSNIALPSGEVARAVMLDFGVAHLRDGSLTIPGERIGTPTYMAPEQVLGAETIGPATDVFALGSVLFECLTGRKAFTGDDAVAVHAKVLLEELPWVSDLVPAVPAALEHLVARMLSKKPADRPASGRELLADLDALVGGGVRTGERLALGPGEQMIASVVVASHRDRLAPDLDQPTLPAHHARERDDSLIATLREMGVEVERLMDGSVIATMAAVGAPSDRATQAARVALALRRRLPGLGVALATGLTPRGRPAMGVVIDRAVALLRRAAELAAIQGAADDPGILLDEVTAGLLDTRFDVACEHGGFALRGERGALEVVRTVFGKVTPFVGRARELGELEMTTAECIEESSAHAVLVVGPPGAGKSRLAAELVRRLQRRPRARPQVWLARADAALGGSPYHLLAQLVRSALGVDAGDPADAVLGVLRARLARHAEGDDLARLTVFLGELLQIAPDGGDYMPLRAARRDARVMRDQLRWAWGDWLRAHLAVGPVLLVVDDLHWGDVTTAKLLEDALQELRDEPLMVVALARPEIEDSLPDVARSGAFELLRVRPLSRRARERLVTEVLGDALVPAQVQQIAERSDGNPFLLEELIRAAADGRDGAPETALAVVTSRIDRLDPEARRLLRAASVFGESFSLAAALHLLGQDGANARQDGALERLARTECVARAAPGGYVFRHALVREAAYRTLTERDRLIGHGLAGEWLEAQGERDPLAVARHFEQGPDPRRAVPWLVLAARRALEADDLAAVHDRAQRAVACGADREQRGQLASLQAEALMWEGDNPRCVSAGLHAMRRVAQGGPEWCRAVGSAAVAAARMGKRRVLALIGRALAAAGATMDRRDDDVWLAVRVSLQLRYVGETALAELLLGQAEQVVGSLSRPMRRLVESYRGGIDANLKPDRYALQADVFRELGDRFRAAQARINHGYALITVGAYDEARSALGEALAEAQRMRSAVLVRHAQNNLGLCLYRLGDLDVALELEAGALAWFRETGDRRLESVTRIYLALIRVASGEIDAGREEAERAVDASRQVPLMRAFALAALAQAHWRGGRTAQALAAAVEASAIDVAEIEEGEELTQLVCAEIFAAAGQAARARAVVAAAARRVRGKADLIADPARRHLFLAAIPENARLLELARAWA